MTGFAENKIKLAWLQCARAFAALYVAAYHAAGGIEGKSHNSVDWFHYVRFGYAGVDLFFVISGFIIVFAHHGDLGRPERLGRYAYRRVTRIYPPYWVLFFCVMPLYFLFPDTGSAYDRNPVNLLGGLLLFPVPPRAVIGIAWSLHYEMLFYAAIGLAIWNRRIGLTILGLWLLGVIAHDFFGPRGFYYINFLFSLRILNFACGAALAYVVVSRGLTRNLAWLGLIGLVGLTILPQILVGSAIYDYDPDWLRLVYIAFSAAILLSCVSLDSVKRPAPRLLVELGNASYSIYLFHWVVQWIIVSGLNRFRIDIDRVVPAPLFLICLWVVMIGASYGAYLIIEKPLLRLSQAYWQRVDKPRSAILAEAVP
jgi:exopolysaccharide production protein ExoZ